MQLEVLAKLRNSFGEIWMRIPSAVLSISILFGLLASPAQLTGQNAEDWHPAPSPEAKAMLLNALTALEGKVPINSITLTGSATYVPGPDSESGSVVMTAAATGDMQLKFSYPSGEQTESRTGSAERAIGNWTGPDGSPHPMPLHNMMADFSWFYPTLLLRNLLQNPNVGVSDDGTENQAQGSTKRQTAWIELPNPSLPNPLADLLRTTTKITVHLDRETLLPSRLTYYTHPDNDARTNIPVEVQFYDYRVIDGTSIPFRVKKLMNGGLILDIHFDSAVPNSSLPEASGNAK
jgi:hypothetical protein